MKRFYALLFCGLAAALISCEKETIEDTRLLQTVITDISDTAATLNCRTTFTDAELAASEVLFLYAPLENGSFGNYAMFTPPHWSLTNGVLSGRLEGLLPETTYVVYMVVSPASGGSAQSARAGFQTANSGNDPDEPEDPDNPGGDPTPGQTRYAGWAELPSEESKPGDYYYAYHMRADANSIRNYSVCYSASMRCAIWTAMPHHESYLGSTKRTDKWQYDPAISAFVQPDLKSSYKESGDGSYSRGHMVASNERTVSAATNAQTFYYTNMAPQIQNGFNGGIWGTLENLCDKELSKMSADTLYVLTGSYYGDKNKICKDNKGNTVYVPTHFYKVLIRSKSGNTKKPLWELPTDQIQCAGWWMDHKVYAPGGSLKPYIKSVAEIEEMTGHKFFANVPNAPKSTVNASDWQL